MQVKAYLDGIIDALSAVPFIESQNISFEERPPSAAYLSGTITFMNGSRLDFKEFLIVRQEKITVVKYGYNYLDKKRDAYFQV